MSLFERLNKVKATKQRPGERTEGRKTPPFPEGTKVSSPLGECILLQKEYTGSLPGPAGGCATLRENLQLLRGVGPCNAEKLCYQGYRSLEELADHPRWGEYARKVLGLVREHRAWELRKLGAGDWELLSLYKPEDIIFLDIESTGLWASQPLFLVGLLYYREGKLVAEQYFARHYREEKAVLEATDKVLRRFKVVVTFNGKRFDLPYITERAVAHRLFYRYNHYHIDLLFHARRHLKHLLPDCRLVTLEENLLDFRRQGDIPGYLIPATYHRFVQTGDPAPVQPILEHNRLDLLAMARLFYLADPLFTAPLHLARRQAAPETDKT